MESWWVFYEFALDAEGGDSEETSVVSVFVTDVKRVIKIKAHRHFYGQWLKLFSSGDGGGRRGSVPER